VAGGGEKGGNVLYLVSGMKGEEGNISRWRKSDALSLRERVAIANAVASDM